ncbi:MarR family transcriptional regulator [Actinoplanes sp. NPDC026623]|uniref:MarR family transcriptional regulator n=1 Tax=Actinoplanes sp. NPDC026623 TaxID=3155610 RepID=UPI0033BFFD18
MTSSTATRMCDRLVRKGLVTRRNRDDDRRAAWMTLTPAGRDLVGDAMRRRATEVGLVGELSMTRPRAVLAAMASLALFTRIRLYMCTRLPGYDRS